MIVRIHYPQSFFLHRMLQITLLKSKIGLKSNKTESERTERRMIGLLLNSAQVKHANLFIYLKSVLNTRDKAIQLNEYSKLIPHFIAFYFVWL